MPAEQTNWQFLKKKSRCTLYPGYESIKCPCVKDQANVLKQNKKIKLPVVKQWFEGTFARQEMILITHHDLSLFKREFKNKTGLVIGSKWVGINHITGFISLLKQKEKKTFVPKWNWGKRISLHLGFGTYTQSSWLWHSKFSRWVCWVPHYRTRRRWEW